MLSPRRTSPASGGGVDLPGAMSPRGSREHAGAVGGSFPSPTNDRFAFDDAEYGAQRVNDVDSVASSFVGEDDEWAAVVPQLQVIEHRSWSVELGQFVILQSVGSVHDALLAIESPEMSDVRIRAAAMASTGIRFTSAQATLSSLNSASSGIVRLVGPARLDATLAAASATLVGAAYVGNLQLLAASSRGAGTSTQVGGHG